ncbi:hypothetical protein CerSpe_273630 [Prunus speciosa]
MFSGLQGSRKTTCTKYAYYHIKKCLETCPGVCRYISSCAFDQLKQNAIMAKIPFYGSNMESDPVKIAVEGVETFSKENCDLMIVDTSGCHKQEAALFEEMCRVSEATKPDLVIFVMDKGGHMQFGYSRIPKSEIYSTCLPIQAPMRIRGDSNGS